MSAGEPADIDSLLEEGLILYGLGKFEEAAKKWARIIDADPQNDRAIELLDIVREDIGDIPVDGDDVSDARKRRKAVMGKPSGDVSEILNKGLELLESGNPENAYEFIMDAIDAGANDPETYGYLEMTRAARLEYYRRLIPDLCKIPQTVMDYDSVKSVNLSKEEGFILSQIDGLITFNDVLSLSRMEKLEAMGILTKLIFNGVIKAD